jgi:Janus kinase 2
VICALAKDKPCLRFQSPVPSAVDIASGEDAMTPGPFLHLNRSQFSFGESIGKGANCEVFRGMLGGVPVAVKVLRFDGSGPDRDRIESAFRTELLVLSTLRHARIVTMLGACLEMPVSEGSGAALIMELMEHGSLYSVLHSSPSPSLSSPRFTSEVEKLRCSLEVAEGMQFLHSRGLFHRDLKSANVLVDGAGRCKVTDFGLSKFRDLSKSHMTGIIGTVAWTAPEILSDGEAVIRDSAVRGN